MFEDSGRSNKFNSFEDHSFSLFSFKLNFKKNDKQLRCLWWNTNTLVLADLCDLYSSTLKFNFTSLCIIHILLQCITTKHLPAVQPCPPERPPSPGSEGPPTGGGQLHCWTCDVKVEEACLVLGSYEPCDPPPVSKHDLLTVGVIYAKCQGINDGLFFVIS